MGQIKYKTYYQACNMGKNILSDVRIIVNNYTYIIHIFYINV